MKKLLVLTSRPLDAPVVETLQRADWEVHYAVNVSEAGSLTAEIEFPVGLLLIWPQDTDQEIANLSITVAAFPKLKWVAALRRGFMEHDARIAMAAEQLFEVLTPPIDGKRLTVILDHALGVTELDNRFLDQRKRSQGGRFGMIGTSPQMKAFFHEIERASACDIPVVVCGETGSGKEMAARSIHANSAFAEGPFITVNCADLPTSWVDADLNSRHIGWLSEMFATEPEQITTANVGTLFLDDVAEMSMPAQASLLRLIDTWSTIRPGTGEPTPVELRVISATNADLYALVEGHRFRSDLYYRLQVLTIQVPSLRERGEDIQALALHFLDEFQQRHPSQVEGFSLAAMRAINQCEWPGNLRELRNRIQQAALYSRDRFIKSADLGLERLDSNRGTVTLQAARDAAERLAITKAIRRNRHNMTRAAEELRVSRMTLYRLVEKHNLQREG